MKMLVDLIPAKYRKYLYAAFALASLVYTTYLAANQDWHKALFTLSGMFLAALANANTNATQATEEPQETLDEQWLKKLHED